jgi:hypothetical protein
MENLNILLLWDWVRLDYLLWGWVMPDYLLWGWVRLDYLLWGWVRLDYLLWGWVRLKGFQTYIHGGGSYWSVLASLSPPPNKSGSHDISYNC